MEVPYRCPHCNESFTVKVPGEQADPEHGVGVCCQCGGWFLFQADWTARRFEPEDLLTVPDDMLTVMRRVTAAVRESGPCRCGTTH